MANRFLEKYQKKLFKLSFFWIYSWLRLNTMKKTVWSTILNGICAWSFRVLLTVIKLCVSPAGGRGFKDVRGTWPLRWDKDQKESCPGDARAPEQAYLHFHSNDNEYVNHSCSSSCLHPCHLNSIPTRYQMSYRKWVFFLSNFTLKWENEHPDKEDHKPTGILSPDFILIKNV